MDFQFIKIRYMLQIAMALLLTYAFCPNVFADMVYHSERLPFLAAGAEGHPELRSGFIVNIHPNGPVVGAIQRFMVQGAKPNTDYNIVETVLEGCSPDDGELLSLPRDTLTTNSRGNGHADFVISADELAPFSGLTIGALWTLIDGDVVAYQTECTIGTID